MRDPDNFDAFYTATARRVVGHVAIMTGDWAEAEDAVAEAYGRAWQRWGRLSRYADPEAWVRSVAWRICVSSWRKAVNRTAAHRRHGPPGDAPGLSPDALAIIDALRQIPASQRHAVVLYHLVGLTVEEIAREADVTPGAIRMRLSRGRAALAPFLSDDIPGAGRPSEEVPRNA